MNSKLVTGEMMHQQLTPAGYRFDYPLYYFSFDLDELAELSKKMALFGHNRRAGFSLFDRDYLGPGRASLREKVMALIEQYPESRHVRRIELLTCARVLGHVSNPASFFFCYDEKLNMKFVLVQMRNASGGMHVSILQDPSQEKASRFLRRYVIPKDFPMPPFFDMKGDYEFRFQMQSSRSDIHINLIKNGKPAFIWRISGTFKPFDSKNLLKTLVSYPFTALLNVPRIRCQHAILHCKKKLPRFP